MIQPNKKATQTKVNPIEMYFQWWINEAIDAGYVESIARESTLYNLCPIAKRMKCDVKGKKVIPKEFNLLHSVNYTPDYTIIFTEKAKDIFFTDVLEVDKIDTPFYAFKNKEEKWQAIVDVKATSIGSTYGNNASASTFPIKQKMLWMMYNIFVNKAVIIPMASQGVIISGNGQALFTSCFTPKRYLFTDASNKPRTIHFKWRTMDAWIKDQQSKLNVINTLLSQQTLL